MPWKDNYTTSDEISLRDGKTLWPADRKMGLGVTVNLNPATTGKGIEEKDLASPLWHFGITQGLDAFLRIFAEFDISATFAVPALVAKAYPNRMKEILDAGHEIAAQGLFGESALMSPATEAEHMTQAAEIIARVTGEAPRGWFALPCSDDRDATGSVSDHTVGLLEESGFLYLGNGLADDAPYWWVTDFSKGTSLLTLPYYYHFDDTFFLMSPREGSGLERPQALLRGWRAEFLAQYRRGRYFGMCVSPARSGWGHRLDNLTGFLQEVVAYPGVWTVTGARIAQHWKTNYSAETTLKLAPSIWRDHADSLS